MRIALSIDLAGIADLRQNGFGDVELLEKLRIPGQASEVHEHGSAGIARIGLVHCTSCKIPQQPCIDRPEGKLPLFSFCSRVWNMV